MGDMGDKVKRVPTEQQLANLAKGRETQKLNREKKKQELEKMTLDLTEPVPKTIEEITEPKPEIKKKVVRQPKKVPEPEPEPEPEIKKKVVRQPKRIPEPEPESEEEEQELPPPPPVKKVIRQPKKIVQEPDEDDIYTRANIFMLKKQLHKQTEDRFKHLSSTLFDF